MKSVASRALLDQASSLAGKAVSNYLDKKKSAPAPQPEGTDLGSQISALRVTLAQLQREEARDAELLREVTEQLKAQMRALEVSAARARFALWLAALACGIGLLALMLLLAR